MQGRVVQLRSAAIDAQRSRRGQAAGSQRNSERCLDLSAACDPIGLTESDAKLVRATFERRNLANCQDRIGQLPATGVSGGRFESRAGAFRSRNMEACKRGLPACDPSLLTGPEIALVAIAFQQRHPPKKQPPQSKP